jgi:hypothetical protein
MRTLIIVAIVLAGCTNDTDDKETCDPVGTWTMTMTTVSGTCGIDLSDESEMKMTQADVDKEVDLDTCSATATESMNMPETATEFEFDGTLKMTIEFDGDLLVGEATLDAIWLESGKQLTENGSCTQKYSISGKRK